MREKFVCECECASVREGEGGGVCPGRVVIQCASSMRGRAVCCASTAVGGMGAGLGLVWWIPVSPTEPLSTSTAAQCGTHTCTCTTTPLLQHVNGLQLSILYTTMHLRICTYTTRRGERGKEEGACPRGRMGLLLAWLCTTPSCPLFYLSNAYNAQISSCQDIGVHIFGVDIAKKKRAMYIAKSKGTT